jgi:hypothetical protein
MDIQDRAANHVSMQQIDEIDTYPPLGQKLKRLTLILGRIFEQAHKRDRISEPECNHFYTDYDSLSPETQEVLNSGIMWAVFNPRKLTKIKSAKQPRGKEYHLNHIYAPYFQISYRKKRRLDINPQDFDQLANFKETGAITNIINKFVGRDTIAKIEDLLTWQDVQSYQMNLWSPYEGK